jgi:REP element-mobilizing transposase RayT
MGSQKEPLSNILRDFKSYTSRQIRKEMSTKLYDPEISSIYQQMIQAGTNNSNNKDWQLWQQHNQPKELFSRKVARQKLDYIHFNPVKAGLTKTPQSWLYSSALDYSGGSGLLKITYLQ